MPVHLFILACIFNTMMILFFPPLSKKKLSRAQPADKDFFAVYLPSYCENIMEKYFHPLAPIRFHIFSWQTKNIKRSGNITFMPVDKVLFNEALINCSGIITGGGFETPAEALKLEKKLMVIPISGQYEQQCNAAALEQMGIKKLDKLDDDFTGHFNEWARSKPVQIKYDHSTEDIIAKVMKLSIAHIRERRNNLGHEEFDLTLLPSQ